MIDLRITARDPGAASLLSHLLLEPSLLDNHDCDIWITENVAGYFSGLDLPTRTFPQPPDQTELLQEWDGNPARSILTGTSHYAAFDSLFWDLGKRRSVPTLAVVDFWSNLDRRFKDSKPDRIGVIDDEQAGEARRLGLPETIITGHPRLAAIRRLPDKEPKKRVNVLFVSERIAGDVADGVNDPYGFDEINVFRLVTEASRNAAAAGIQTDLVVKFHPYNDHDEFLNALGPLADDSTLSIDFIDGDEPIAPFVAACDLVVGMSSVALIEAALMGRPVVSVQPGLIREDMFVPAVKGFSETQTDPDSAVNFVSDLIVDPEKRQEVSDRFQGFRNCVDTSRATPLSDWLRSVLSPPALDTATELA